MYVRFAHEMNGTGWYPWQVGGACGVTSAANYVAGFNHVALRAEGPFRQDPDGVVRERRLHQLRQFYASAADIIGFDGYN